MNGLVQAGGREALAAVKQILVWWLHGIGAQIALGLILFPGGFGYGLSTALGASQVVGVGIGVLAIVFSLWGFGIAKAWRAGSGNE